jgi:hypothetical protein
LEGAALNRPLANQFDGNEERKWLPQTTFNQNGKSYFDPPSID